MSQCGYFHVQCSCGSYICRGFFPEEQKKITPEMAKICRSPEHVTECLRYQEAVKYQEAKQEELFNGDVCRFLNKKCAGCRDYSCKGGVPPFIITNYAEGITNNVENCMTREHVNCPYYKEGLEHIELWKRVKGH